MQSEPVHKCLISGFSFLEIMFALSVIAIVITGVFRLQSQAVYMNNEARFYTTAPLLAQKVVAEYEKDPGRFADSSGDFGENYNGYSWSRQVEEIEPETLGENAPEMKKIEVTVAYDESVYAYSVRVYRYVPEEE